jgi:hypothetical protein
MTKVVLRVLLAVVCLAVAVMAQLPQGGPETKCGLQDNKQDCQDCCVTNKQIQFQQCQAANGGQACLQEATDTFNACMNSCKSLPNETGPGEAHTNTQGGH